MSYIGKVKVDNQTEALVGSTLFGISSTAAATAAKEVTLSNFDEFLPGVTIHVKFVNGNTVTSGVTLQVGTTTAKNVSGNCVCAANEVIAFTLEDDNGTKTWRANHSIVVSTGTQNGTIKIAGQEVGVYGLGNAAYKGYTTTISDSSTNNDVPSAAAVYAYVQSTTGGLAGITGAMHFRGIVTSSSVTITDGGHEDPGISTYDFGINGANAVNGDVICQGNREYVWVTDHWEELGNEGIWALDSEVVHIPASSAIGDILYYNGSTYTRLAIGTGDNKFLKVNSGIPSWGTVGKSDVGLGNVDNNSVLNGETGDAGDLIYWSAANTPARLATGTSGYVLTVNSSGLPAWQANAATDQNVTQTAYTNTTNNYDFDILFKNTNSHDTETGGVNFSAISGQTLQFNPKTGTLKSKYFSGDGSALTNVVASSVAWSAVTSKDYPVFYVNTTAAGTNSDVATANTTTYIHLYQDSARRSGLQIIGAGGTTVAANASKVITITSKEYTSTGSANAFTALSLSYLDTNGTTQTSNVSSTAITLGHVASGVLYLKSISGTTTSVSTGVAEVTS